MPFSFYTRTCRKVIVNMPDYRRRKYTVRDNWSNESGIIYWYFVFVGSQPVIQPRGKSLLRQVIVALEAVTQCLREFKRANSCVSPKHILLSHQNPGPFDPLSIAAEKRDCVNAIRGCPFCVLKPASKLIAITSPRVLTSFVSLSTGRFNAN